MRRYLAFLVMFGLLLLVLVVVVQADDTWINYGGGMDYCWPRSYPRAHVQASFSCGAAEGDYCANVRCGYTGTETEYCCDIQMFGGQSTADCYCEPWLADYLQIDQLNFECWYRDPGPEGDIATLTGHQAWGMMDEHEDCHGYAWGDAAAVPLVNTFNCSFGENVGNALNNDPCFELTDVRTISPTQVFPDWYFRVSRSGSIATRGAVGAGDGAWLWVGGSICVGLPLNQPYDVYFASRAGTVPDSGPLYVVQTDSGETTERYLRLWHTNPEAYCDPGGNEYDHWAFEGAYSTGLDNYICLRAITSDSSSWELSYFFVVPTGELPAGYDCFAYPSDDRGSLRTDYLGTNDSTAAHYFDFNAFGWDSECSRLGDLTGDSWMRCLLGQVMTRSVEPPSFTTVLTLTMDGYRTSGTTGLPAAIFLDASATELYTCTWPTRSTGDWWRDEVCVITDTLILDNIFSLRMGYPVGGSSGYVQLDNVFLEIDGDWLEPTPTPTLTPTPGTPTPTYTPWPTATLTPIPPAATPTYTPWPQATLTATPHPSATLTPPYGGPVATYTATPSDTPTPTPTPIIITPPADPSQSGEGFDWCYPPIICVESDEYDLGCLDFGLFGLDFEACFDYIYIYTLQLFGLSIPIGAFGAGVLLFLVLAIVIRR